jgi:hypothetical protein
VIGNAVKVMRIATGEETEELETDQAKSAARVLPGVGRAKTRCAIAAPGSYPSTPLAETPRPSHRR